MQIGRLLSGACLVGVFFALCVTANAADNAEAICNAVAKAFDAAVASGDSVNVGAMYTPDGEFVTPFGVVDGPDAIARAEASGIKPGAKAVTTVLRSRMVGDMALCIGEFTFTYATGVPGAEVKGYWTRLVRRVGNDWKIEVLTYNRRFGE